MGDKEEQASGKKRRGSQGKVGLARARGTTTADCREGLLTCTTRGAQQRQTKESTRTGRRAPCRTMGMSVDAGRTAGVRAITETRFVVHSAVARNAALARIKKHGGAGRK